MLSSSSSMKMLYLRAIQNPTNCPHSPQKMPTISLHVLWCCPGQFSVWKYKIKMVMWKLCPLLLLKNEALDLRRELNYLGNTFSQESLVDWRLGSALAWPLQADNILTDPSIASANGRITKWNEKKNGKILSTRFDLPVLCKESTETRLLLFLLTVVWLHNMIPAVPVVNQAWFISELVLRLVYFLARFCQSSFQFEPRDGLITREQAVYTKQPPWSEECSDEAGKNL